MSALRSTLAGLVSLCALAGALAVLPAAAAAEECPNAAFRTGPSTHLPDCRAYEQVTPPYKASGFREEGELRLGPEGTSVGYQSFSAFNGSEGFADTFFGGPHYTARRTAAGWVSMPEELPASEYLPYEYAEIFALMNTSLGSETSVYAARKVGQAENRVDLFLHDPDGSIADVGPALPPTAPAGLPIEIGESVDLLVVGESADASRLLFDLSRDFWPFDGTEEALGNGGEGRFHSLYEYLGTGNTSPLLVGVDDSGRLISQCGTVLGAGDPTGNAGNGLIDSNHNAMSTDGNTVFFTAYPGCKGSAPPVAELFARIDNGLSDAHTVAISEPSKEDCAACDTEAGVLQSAHFEGASEDGSKVFFSTTQPLLGGDTSRNIYEYDFDAPAGQRVVRVSGGDSTVSEPTADVLPTRYGEPESAGPPGISEDGSHVYFVAHGVLTRTPNGQGESAQPGAENLYVFERDAEYPAGRTAFIAQLSAEDVQQWGAEGDEREERGSGPDVTPDGRFLVFTSNRDLTPDDTSSARQVFEYDAQTGALVRVSIGQDGFNHDGNVVGNGANNASIPTPDYGFRYEPSAYWSSLAVSADGSYVFFQSSVGLTPQALDEVEGAENVYEYHDGRVSLISDGQDTVGVRLLSTDESGDDVFFETVDRLVGQDTGTDVDIYDARIDGGFPAPAPPPSCSGEACQGLLSGAPTLLSPGSEFQAGGNPPLAAAPPVAVAKPEAKAKKGPPKKSKRKAKARRAGDRRRAGR